ncbi:ankyrin repeat domain-containing protein [Thermoactinomyces sp. DSM 45892]|uniref:ankyrin repeat domain-containing protein n=1 Tax=Thermoactinomyces sp. DSM 45892 TaxID=1882753 RepID=UPI0008963720|nr:ankyrin repeat domain-containing protein [Thermoactinomyces sp. DSM 45892]SDX97567.1 Ankyrin repeat-containing protein [Thermoactinomyces sp. DSM 45892]
MNFFNENDKLAMDVISAIHTGNIPMLKEILSVNPDLSTARIMGRDRMSRTLLHVVTDSPGHFPNGAEAVTVLVEAGADVNARFSGSHTETPLHWAASNNDIEILDMLLDFGADIEADGAVIAGGTPLDDAIAFAQWGTAYRLAERGAQLALWHAAALGKMDVVEAYFAGGQLSAKYPWVEKSTSPTEEMNVSFWCACHGGQRNAAEYLLHKGANLNWISLWDNLTPLDAAQRSHATDLVQWLRNQGAKSISELS